MDPLPPPPLRIDVVSDVVCPWCFVGKRQLEEALRRWAAAHPGAPAPEVRWLPFQLNPDMPPEGIDRREYLQRKFGRGDPAAIYNRVREAAAAAGLDLELQAIGRQPNTLRAHALVHFAGEEGRQDAMVEALFDAYFRRGVDLTRDETLRALGAEAGLDEGSIAEALGNEAVWQAIADADLQARELGIDGVPFFIVGGRIGVAGAAGADALVQAFERAATAP